MYWVRRLHLGGNTVTKHEQLAEAFEKVAAWHSDGATRKVTLIRKPRQCCQWQHVRPCGPIIHEGCTHDEHCECAPYCACGCSAFDERCS